MSKPKVGFIGLGAMGLQMARRVLGAGYKMYATFHRRREPAEQLQAMGADILSNASEVAKAADVIITILPADAERNSTGTGRYHPSWRFGENTDRDDQRHTARHARGRRSLSQRRRKNSGRPSKRRHPCCSPGNPDDYGRR